MAATGSTALAQRLTPRWTPLSRHTEQLRLVEDTRPRGKSCRPRVRFVVVPAGRRSGKTERAKRQIVKYGLKAPEGSNYFFGAPTRDQAKRIYWRDLKLMVPKWAQKQVRESDLEIHLTNGNMLAVIGMDKPERIEGSPWAGGVLDEYGNMKAEAWLNNVRPALSEKGREGFCWLIGVPEGRNHYYERYIQALEDPSGYAWGAYTWHSDTVLSAEEIAAAKRDMDELTFRQEYQAEFINFVGQCYYPFARETHCANLRQLYNPDADLIVCFDFNVDPGVAVICQEFDLPEEEEHMPVVIKGRQLFGKVVKMQRNRGTAVIGEVHIPVNSNTPAVCRRITADWGEHRGRILVYGDATGGARGTAQTEGSDWDLVRNALYERFGPERTLFFVPDSNPTERARVNAMNSRLRSQDGTIRMMVDPVAAPNTVLDLEGVRLLEGGSGEIDKKRDPKLTHLSDGLGYYVVHRFPVRKEEAESVPLRI